MAFAIEQNVDQPVNCQICNMQFSNKKMLMLHTKKAHENASVLRCDVCHISFKERPVLEFHLWRVHNIGNFKCGICGKVFGEQTQLTSHYQEEHPQQIKHKCPKCEKVFSDLNSLKSHFDSVHNSRKTLKCDFCVKTFHDPPALIIHIKQEHHNVGKGTEMFSCQNCNTTFIASALVEAHDCPATAFKCDFCDKGFRTTKSLVDHINAWHSDQVSAGNQFQCEKCARSFVASSILKKHSCVQDFDYTSGKLHPTGSIITKKQPTGNGNIKLFSCNSCNSAFPQQRMLESHFKNFHTTPYKCGFCDKAFNRQKQLDDHVFSAHPLPLTPGSQPLHMNPTPQVQFKIHQPPAFLVGQTTVQPYLSQPLTQQVASGTQQTFPCHLCNKTFTAKRNIDRHIQTVHNNSRQFSCSKCGVKFGAKQTLERHYENVHLVKSISSGSKPVVTSQYGLSLGHGNIFSNVFNQPIQLSSQIQTKVVEANKPQAISVKEVRKDNLTNKCNFCGRVCSSLPNLLYHINTTHYKKKVVSDNKAHTCFKCNKTFANQEAVQAHYRDFHKDKEEADEVVEIEPEPKRIVVNSNIQQVTLTNIVAPPLVNVPINSSNNVQFQLAPISNTDQSIQMPATTLMLGNFLQNPFNNPFLGESTSNLNNSTVQEIHQIHGNEESSFVNSSNEFQVPDDVIRESNGAMPNLSFQNVAEPPASETYECDVCRKVFGDLKPFKDHIKKDHNKNKIYTCTICGKIFAIWLNFTLHLEQMHQSDPDIFKTSNDLMENVSNDTVQMPDSVREPPHKMPNKHKLKNTSDKIEKYECDICETISKDAENFKKHVTTSHKDVFQLLKCKHCEKYFTMPENLNSHLKVLHSVKVPLEQVPISNDQEENPKANISDNAIETNEKSLLSLSDSMRRSKSLPISDVTVAPNFPSTINPFGKDILTSIPIEAQSEDNTTTESFAENETKKYKCEYCGRGFNQMYALKRHMKLIHSIHDGLKSYNCFSCQKDFYSSHGFKVHMDAVHKNIQFKCNFCDKYFSSNDVLKQHVKSEHEIDDSDAEKSPFKKEVSSTYENANNAADFDAIRNFDVINSFDLNFLQSNNESENEKNNFEISVMNDDANVEAPLKDQEVSPQSLFECNFCKKVFSNGDHLKAHIKEIHESFNVNNQEINEKPFECSPCGKYYKSKEGLQKHIESIHEKIKFDCNICGSSFTSRNGLRYHQTHSLNCDPSKTTTKIEASNEVWDIKHEITEQEEYIEEQGEYVEPGQVIDDEDQSTEYLDQNDDVDNDFVEEAAPTKIESYSPELRWKCQTCSKGFKSESGWSYHVKKGVCQKESFLKCLPCNVSFPYGNDLMSHNVNVHNKEAIENTHEMAPKMKVDNYQPKRKNLQKSKSYPPLLGNVDEKVCDDYNNAKKAKVLSDNNDTTKNELNPSLGYQDFKCKHCPNGFATNTKEEMIEHYFSLHMS